MTDQIILQNLRDFTVQIRHPQSEAIVGTGIAISLDGHIVTCAHVVEMALGMRPCLANGKEVGVYFPQARGRETKARRATIAASFIDCDDDVVLLQLDGRPPLGREQIPTLGTADASVNHDFRSYGYAPLGNRISRYADGEIVGPVEIAPGTKLREEPIELRTRNIRRGMSGGPVLDIERNLVVGLVTSYWQDEDDPDNIAYATNGKVLTLEPLNLLLEEGSLAKGTAAQPDEQYQAAAREYAHVQARSEFHAAQPPLAEWVGRAELLQGLDRDYADPDRRVTGLIGFGGEGKSSLARKWVDLLDDLPIPQGHSDRPTGIFWWDFYDNPNADEFFETALGFISGGTIDPRRIPSSSAKAQVIAAMLANGHYLFVLDGLEVLQQQKGDQYGLLTSPDLQTFLELFVAPGHQSFCLITSRAPLLDLMKYTSYTHRDVGPVAPQDGRALLRALGVKGRSEELDKLIAQWDGHALTLSLLGSFLAWCHGGNISFASEFEPLSAVGEVRDAPLPDEAPEEARQRYAHVHRILLRYDEHLSDEERAFMTLFSAWHSPVGADSFTKVFREFPETDVDEGRTLQKMLAVLDDAEFDGLVGRLVDYRLLRLNERVETYKIHPLVRSHYLELLTRSGQAGETHRQLKEYYLGLSGITPHNPTLEDLTSLIEVVYHACLAGSYDYAYQFYWERISQRDRFYDVYVLGAFETSLNIMLQFFLNGDTSQEPQVSNARDKSWILNRVGLCQMSLGRLEKAVPFFERATRYYFDLEDWSYAGIGFRNMAALNIHLGRLEASASASGQALEMARRAKNEQDEYFSLAHQAWVDHLCGEVGAAGEAFRQAEALQRETDDSALYLYSLRGIKHAQHLWRVSDMAYARQVTEANLEICERKDNWSRSHRLLGELDAAQEHDELAHFHFDTALTIARGISRRDALIEALLGRGRWAARLSEEDLRGFQNLAGLEHQAFSDLREALGYALDGGYRIYESDIRVALAWAYVRAKDLVAAREEAERAKMMSEVMGYYWGKVDADEVLGQITLQQFTN